MRLLIAVSLLVLQLCALTAPVACFGWEMSASARMACCRQEHPKTAPTQAAADECCAQHQQARQPALDELAVRFVTLLDATVLPLTSPTAALLPATGALASSLTLPPASAGPPAFSPPLRV